MSAWWISSINNTPEGVNIFYQPLIPEGVYHLDADESRHCIKVLRHKKGDEIRLTDGKGKFYDTLLTSEDSRGCTFEIRKTIPEELRRYSIGIAISPTKNADRIEWFVEKAVEFGIDTIHMMECKNTERSFIKTDRLVKVAVSAMKQSMKARIPIISDLRPFHEIVSTPDAQGRFIAFVDANNPVHLNDVASKNQKYLVLIGPEGDFSSEELTVAIANGFQKISLGASRLRTETAGLAACHILNLINS